MVSTGKLAVISVLAILGLGSLGGGWYAGNYIGNALDEGIKDSLVVDPNFSTDDPEGYADWLTNEDDDDPAKYKRYYFWNLTNPNEYLTGSTPVYKEIGPYSYRQYDIKISVQITSTTVKYQTYTYYVFDAAESFVGASVDDNIVNVNPAYIGVIAGAGSELNLRFSFTSSAVGTIVAGLQGDFTSAVLAQGSGTALDTTLTGLTTEFPIAVASGALEQMIDGYIASFLPKAQAGAVPQVLETIQDQVTTQLYAVVNGSTTATVIQQNLAGIASGSSNNTAWYGFFNGTSGDLGFSVLGATINGISEFAADTNMQFTNTSAQRLLYDGVPALGVDGWVSDLTQGKGVLGFLQAYQSAVDPTYTLLDLNALAALYNATTTQINTAVGYLTSYMFDAVVPATISTLYSTTPLNLANVNFYAQWANATVDPTGFDLNGDDVSPDGFEAGINLLQQVVNATGISLATAMNLFDEDNLLSLTNDTGILVWYGAAAGDTTNQTSLITNHFAGNATKLTMILNWLGNFVDYVVPGALVSKFADQGVTEFNDLAYLQWGNSSLTAPYSLFEIDSTSSTNYTEFWAWSNRVDKSYVTFNASFVKALLNGTSGMFDPTQLGTFLFLFNGGVSPNLGAINAIWGLNTTETIAFAGYINYVLNELIIKPVSPLGVSSVSDLGYLQWSSPLLLGGDSILDLDSSAAPNYPEYWAWASKIAGSADNGTSFTVAEAKALFSGPNSLTNGTNTLTFLTLVQGGSAANFTAIESLYGLNVTEAVAFASYLNYVIEEILKPTLIFLHGSLGYTGVSDIGYLQFATPVLTGDTLFNLNAPLPGYPEPWAYYDSLGVDYEMNVTNSKALLSGDYNFTDATSIGTFLALAQGANSTDATTSATSVGTINVLFGSKLNKTDVLYIAGWLNHVMVEFIDKATLGPIFALGGGLITDRTVTEWLFDYDDPLLAFLLANGLVDSAANNFFSNHDGPTDPRISPSSTTMTGGDDINNVGLYVNWQGNAVIPSRTSDPVNGIWDHAEEVKGTDATQFHPGVEEDEVLEAWVSELMRTVDLAFLDNVQTEGIDLLRFVLADHVLAVDAHFDQTITGVANMTVAIGAPLFISKPHFLDAASTATSVSGMSPDRALHETFIDVEPTTGAVMNAAKRLQLSFQVGPGNFFTPGIAATDRLPILWVEEGGKITHDLAEDFKAAVYTAQQYQQIAPIGGAAIGVVLLLTSMFIAIRARKP